MKLLFLTPPMANWKRWGARHVACNALYAHLAAYVRTQKVAQVEVLDCRALGLDEEAMIESIRKSAPDAIFVGTRVVTEGGAGSVMRYLEALETVKQAFPSIVTISGGLALSSMPKDILGLAPQLDYIVIGEADRTLAELLEQLKSAQPNLKDVLGLAYREQSEIRFTAPRPLIIDLNELPMPAYDLFPMDKYIGFSRIAGYNEAVTSRGCEGACSFCYEWGLVDFRRRQDFFVHRTRSGKLVADEMELLSKTYGVKALNFMDDDFNSDRQKIVDLLDEIEKRRIDMQWFFMGRARNLLRDADLIPRMRRAGCYQVLFGIEVGSDEELVNLHKSKDRYTIGDLRELVRLLRRNDISTVGTYMSGFWEDDATKIRQRFRAVDDIDPDIGVLMLLTPMPGSPVWRQALTGERVENIDLKNWDAIHTVMPTRHLSRQELGALSAEINREFFSRPERIERIRNGYSSPYVRAKFETYSATADQIDR
ncbi:MAG TPA: radical SAM protein [Verrucomicrobiae bacterium]|nr:radical SAM protein [Verrucomicrobiae bacterium]